MDDQTYVAFINAHTECGGGHYDVDIAIYESVLILSPFPDYPFDRDRFCSKAVVGSLAAMVSALLVLET